MDLKDEVVGEDEGCSAWKLKEGQCGCSFEGRARAAGEVKCAGGQRGLNPEALLVH